jgi:hypothetical protein
LVARLGADFMVHTLRRSAAIAAREAIEEGRIPRGA